MPDEKPNTPPPQRPVAPSNQPTTHGENNPSRPLPPDNRYITEDKDK